MAYDSSLYSPLAHSSVFIPSRPLQVCVHACYVARQACQCCCLVVLALSCTQCGVWSIKMLTRRSGASGSGGSIRESGSCWSDTFVADGRCSVALFRDVQAAHLVLPALPHGHSQAHPAVVTVCIKARESSHSLRACNPKCSHDSEFYPGGGVSSRAAPSPRLKIFSAWCRACESARLRKVCTLAGLLRNLLDLPDGLEKVAGELVGARCGTRG